MSIEEYERILEKQKGVCVICQGINKDGRSLFVDHDHRIGDIRGLLCSNCNALIGLADENIAVLERAIAYIAQGDVCVGIARHRKV
jgi:hypothetical protein